MTKKLKEQEIGIFEPICASDLIGILVEMIKTDPNTMVTIRQTDGTDFPPFLAIETIKSYVKNNKENVFVEQF